MAWGGVPLPDRSGGTSPPLASYLEPRAFQEQSRGRLEGLLCSTVTASGLKEPEKVKASSSDDYHPLSTYVCWALSRGEQVLLPQLFYFLGSESCRLTVAVYVMLSPFYKLGTGGSEWLSNSTHQGHTASKFQSQVLNPCLSNADTFAFLLHHTACMFHLTSRLFLQ